MAPTHEQQSKKFKLTSTTGWTEFKYRVLVELEKEGLKEQITGENPVPPHPDDINRQRKGDGKDGAITTSHWDKQIQRLREWRKEDAKARSIIVDMLGTVYLLMNRRSNTAQELWQSLEKKFDQRDTQRESDIRSKLAATNLYGTHINGDVEAYINRFLLTLEEYYEVRQGEVNERDVTLQFLEGLKECKELDLYITLMQGLNPGDQLQDLDTCISRCREHARRKGLPLAGTGRRQNQQGSSQPAFAAQNNNNNNRGNNRQRGGRGRQHKDACTVCTNARHTNENCYVQHPEKKPQRQNDNKKDNKDNKDNNTESKDKGKKKDDSQEHHTFTYAAIPSSSKAPSGPNTPGRQPLPVFPSRTHRAQEHVSGKVNFIVDSGSGINICNDLSMLRDVHQGVGIELQTTAGATTVDLTGSISLRVDTPYGVRYTLNISNVAYVPQSQNLLCSYDLEENCNMYRKGVTMFDATSGQPCFQLQLVHKTYILSASPERYGPGQPCQAYPAVPEATSLTPEILHQRLAHSGTRVTSLVMKYGDDLQGVDAKGKGKQEPCETCHLAKSQRTPFLRHERTNRPLARIHYDPIGAITPRGFVIQTSQYVLIITDDNTRFRWTYLQLHKDETYRNVTGNTLFLRNKFPEWPVCEYQQDGGTESGGNKLNDFATEHGIIVRRGASYNPEQNGSAESTNKAVMTRSRCMMIDSGLPKRLWPEAVMYATHISNRIPSGRDRRCPWQLLYYPKYEGIMPYPIGHLRRFGCVAYVHRPQETRVQSAKFEPRARRMFFIGFQGGERNYRVIDPDTSEIKVSPHVTFNESIVYGQIPGNEGRGFRPADLWPEYGLSKGYGGSHAPDVVDEASSTQYNISTDDEFDDIESSPDDETIHAGSGNFLPLPRAPQTPPAGSSDPSKGAPDRGEQSHETPESTVRLGDDIHDLDVGHESNSSGLSSPPSSHAEEDENEITPQQDAANTEDQSSARRSLRSQRRLNYRRVHSQGLQPPESHFARYMTYFACAAVDRSPDEPYTDPLTLEEALKRPDADAWRAASKSEVDQLISTGTIKLIPRNKLPYGQRLISSRMVFKKKLNPDGSVDKYKARLVARGFEQRYGIDYQETQSSTLLAATLRVLLAMANHFGWHILQADVVGAFLNGNLGGLRLYIEMPPGFDQRSVCEVLKTLYGLKQSPHLWQKEFTKAMLELGFISLFSDVCLFKNPDSTIYVLVFVDDILIVGPVLEILKQFREILGKRFQLNDVEESAFLGLVIKRDRKNRVLRLSQAHYTNKILEDFGMAHCKPASTPGRPDLLLPYDGETSVRQSRLFMAITGSLQYLACHTRLDIAFHTNRLCQFNKNPGPAHWQAGKQMFRYLKGTADAESTFTPSTDLRPTVAYSDADFAGDPNERCSTTGIVIKLAGGPVIWRSKLQKVQALSSTEAEYNAISEASREVQWLQNLLQEMCVTVPRPFLMLEDNQSTINIATNHANHKRSKHVDLRNHRTRKLVEQGVIKIEYVHTDEQVADGFTKALPPAKWPSFLQQLNLH